MKRVTLFLAIFFAIGFTPASAEIIVIPGDYPTIQEGIDAAGEGDTVLVKPGEYVENIDFIGKNIVVASLFLTSGNPEYIISTIIDGNSSGSVVTFENGEDSTAVIEGFTIRNGLADYGCGICCVNSSPTISNNDIRDNGNSNTTAGGGISCYNSNAFILHNSIHNNVAGCGGGIFCWPTSSAIISFNRIYDNYADW